VAGQIGTYSRRGHEHWTVRAFKVGTVRKEGPDLFVIYPEDEEPWISENVDLQWFCYNTPEAGGYLITYDDGDRSFLPEDIFHLRYQPVESE
jgi:hypothetical protein